MLITVFIGFSRSYYLKPWYGTQELSRLLHLHGVIFTAWVVFFLVQERLAEARAAAGRSARRYTQQVSPRYR